MIRQCFLANTGIRFHTALFPNVGLDPATLYPTVQPRPEQLSTADIVSEETYEALLKDAEATLATQLAAETSTPLPPGMHIRTDSAQTLVGSAPPTPACAAPTSALPAPAPLVLRKTTMQRLTDAPLGMLTEEEEDLADLLCPLYDQLALAPGWWVLEVVPMTQRFQDPEDNHWEERVVVNWGHGREVPVPTPVGEGKKVRFHRSVKEREVAGEMVQWTDGKKRKYVPKATVRPQVEYVA